MRSTPAIRTTFAKALPQEILSDIVIVLSDFVSEPAAPPQVIKRQLDHERDADAEQSRNIKRVRRSGGEDNASAVVEGPVEAKPAIKKLTRKPDGSRRNSRRMSLPAAPLNPEQELEFCRGLIERMIRGPGFWTRLVGPFKQPVDPAVDNVPNYFDVVKRPMDLNTIRTKMINNVYKSAAEFEADVRLISKIATNTGLKRIPSGRHARNSRTTLTLSGLSDMNIKVLNKG